MGGVHMKPLYDTLRYYRVFRHDLEITGPMTSPLDLSFMTSISTELQSFVDHVHRAWWAE